MHQHSKVANEVGFEIRDRQIVGSVGAASPMCVAYEPPRQAIRHRSPRAGESDRVDERSG